VLATALIAGLGIANPVLAAAALAAGTGGLAFFGKASRDYLAKPDEKKGRWGYALNFVSSLFSWLGAFLVALLVSGVASAQTSCGEPIYAVARPNGSPAASWGATDNAGAPSNVTVDVFWNPQGGTPINIATMPGSAVKTVAEGGTPLTLTTLLCSGLTGTFTAKAKAANGMEAAAVPLPVTFRVPAKPPGAPSVLSRSS
jgi:hypothetical protein